MFTETFFPTPPETIIEMCEGEELRNKTILEPSAGKGDIVDFCFGAGAVAVLACETNEDLRKILATKCQIVANDFLTLESHAISHIDYIIMNPPFDTADKHITHAYNIAPPGCKIIALCNTATLDKPYSATRKELNKIIEAYGESRSIGNVFATAERKTDVETSLLKILKPGSNYNTEFEGFFTDEEPEEIGENGIMSYNVVRDLVNRYVGAVKIFDEQLTAAVKMNNLTTGFFSSGMGMSVTEKGVPIQRNEFKKAMQKSGWDFIFKKMNMAKYATRGLKEDINKFVEKQTQIPFTMKNIYKMLEIVVGTQSSRMDKALEEVFDKITSLSKDNQFNLPGFQTNSHYLVNPKFIIDNMCYQDKRYYTGNKIEAHYGNSFDLIEDFVKALCYITGDKYETLGDLRSWIVYRYKIMTDDDVIFKYETAYTYNSKDAEIKKLYEQGKQYKVIDWAPVYGEWFEWSYFKCKAFKKGTMHFEFKDNDLWAQFNIRIARIKGYPLFEHKEETKWQKQQKNKRA